MEVLHIQNYKIADYGLSGYIPVSMPHLHTIISLLCVKYTVGVRFLSIMEILILINNRKKAKKQNETKKIIKIAC